MRKINIVLAAFVFFLAIAGMLLGSASGNYTAAMWAFNTMMWCFGYTLSQYHIRSLERMLDQVLELS